MGAEANARCPAAQHAGSFPSSLATKHTAQSLVLDPGQVAGDTRDSHSQPPTHRVLEAEPAGQLFREQRGGSRLLHTADELLQGRGHAVDGQGGHTEGGDGAVHVDRGGSRVQEPVPGAVVTPQASPRLRESEKNAVMYWRGCHAFTAACPYSQRAGSAGFRGRSGWGEEPAQDIAAPPRVSQHDRRESVQGRPYLARPEHRKPCIAGSRQDLVPSSSRRGAR